MCNISDEFYFSSEHIDSKGSTVCRVCDEISSSMKLF